MRDQLLIFSMLIALTSSQIVTSYSPYQYPPIQPCVVYKSGNCIICPYNYHINQNQCYLNIPYCLNYSINNLAQQFCSNCDQTLSKSDGNGGCALSISQLTSVVVSTTTTTTVNSVDSQYGDNRFHIITLSAALEDPYFNICNRYMLKGQYSHFILQISQPLQAVSFFTAAGQNNYKILYSGSGGGLMMSIITITIATKALRLSSFVAIGTSNIVPYCAQYRQTLMCQACMIDYHLEGSACYQNIAGCVSYFRNICLQCAGFAVLIQNRCVSCSAQVDLGKAVFYGVLWNYIGGWTLPYLSQGYLLRL